MVEVASFLSPESSGRLWLTSHNKALLCLKERPPAGLRALAMSCAAGGLPWLLKLIGAVQALHAQLRLHVVERLLLIDNATSGRSYC